MAAFKLSDIYARVHKGLRKALFDLAYVAGRTDYSNDGELNYLKERTAETIHFLKVHGHVEDAYQLPALESRVPGITSANTDDHHRIEQEIEQLLAMLEQVGTLAPEERVKNGEEWYLRLNCFISDYLAHMHEEETIMAPLYFEHCTEEDFHRIYADILANSAPQDTMLMLKYTIPSVDHEERASFLSKIKSSAPPQAFDAVMNLVQGVLNDNEWNKLRTALA